MYISFSQEANGLLKILRMEQFQSGIFPFGIVNFVVDDDDQYIYDDEMHLKGTLIPKTLASQPIILDPTPRGSIQG